MITIGVVYLNSNALPAKDLIHDLSEMCRGVQHPMRGLFLRNYLLQSLKNSLNFLNRQDDLLNSIDFILTNFCEMNRLWVRMQYQGHSKEHANRELERKELRLLVGSNILCLSQLEQLSIEIYSERVLPFISEQIISCKDCLAQTYLFECIIQAFPDAYHIHTFQKLMIILTSLQAGVSVHTLLGSLTQRLATFSHTSEGELLFNENQMINKCVEHTNEIINNASCIPREEVVGLYKFVLRLAFDSKVSQKVKLDTSLTILDALENYLNTGNCVSISSRSSLGLQIIQFLSSIMECGHNSKTISLLLELLRLPTFEQIVERLENSGRNIIATQLLESLNSANIQLCNSDDINLIMRLISPLMDNPWIKDGDELINIIDQQLLGSFVHRIYLTDESIEIEIELFSNVMKKFRTGGHKQLIYRIPSVVNAIFNAIKQRSTQKDVNPIYYSRMLMDVAYNGITDLISDHVEVALHLLIQGALIIGSIKFDDSETYAYEFITQAFALFEDSIVESHKQMNALILIYGAVHRLQCFSAKESFNLRKRLVQASMLLIKRSDQCRMLTYGSILHWNIQVSDQEDKIFEFSEVYQCLQKARQLASKCIHQVTQCQLLLDIVDQYLYIIEDNPEFLKELNTVSDVIKDILKSTLILAKSSNSNEANLMINRMKDTICYVLDQEEKLEPLSNQLKEFKFD